MRKKLRDLLWGKKLTAAFARVRCVHPHKVLVRIAECIDGVILITSEAHVPDAVKQFDEFCVALGDGRAELVVVHVEILEESRQIALARRACRRAFDVMKDALQCFVEIFVRRRVSPHILEQFTRQDKEPLLVDNIHTLRLCLRVGQCSIVKCRIPCLTRLVVEVVRQLLRDIAIEECAKHVLLEIPAIHTSSQVIRNLPDRPMQLRALHFLLVVHVFPPSLVFSHNSRNTDFYPAPSNK